MRPMEAAGVLLVALMAVQVVVVVEVHGMATASTASSQVCSRVLHDVGSYLASTHCRPYMSCMLHCDSVSALFHACRSYLVLIRIC